MQITEKHFDINSATRQSSSKYGLAGEACWTRAFSLRQTIPFHNWSSTGSHKWRLDTHVMGNTKSQMCVKCTTCIV